MFDKATKLITERAAGNGWAQWSELLAAEGFPQIPITEVSMWAGAYRHGEAIPEAVVPHASLYNAMRPHMRKIPGEPVRFVGVS